MLPQVVRPRSETHGYLTIVCEQIASIVCAVASKGNKPLIR